MGSLLAVDGNSLGHRAWHALRGSALSGPWVTHGVVRMLASAWAYGPFDAVLVAFDSPTSLRKGSYPDYKANRDPHDPALHEQFARMAALLAACGLEVHQVDGYEADDLLASAALRCERAGVPCTLLSSDRDLLALVSEHVRLLRPRATMSHVTLYDPHEVEDEFGVPPDRYLELAALRGDTSDNLPGVPGVGPKTAAKLIASWGSIDALYDGLRHLSPDLAGRLRDAEADVVRNLALMSPLTNHPIDVETIAERGIDLDLLTTTLAGAGLRQAAEELRLAVQRAPAPPPPPPPPTDTTDYGASVAPRIDPGATPAPVHYRGEQVALFER